MTERIKNVFCKDYFDEGTLIRYWNVMWVWADHECKGTISQCCQFQFVSTREGCSHFGWGPDLDAEICLQFMTQPSTVEGIKIPKMKEIHQKPSSAHIKSEFNIISMRMPNVRTPSLSFPSVLVISRLHGFINNRSNISIPSRKRRDEGLS